METICAQQAMRFRLGWGQGKRKKWSEKAVTGKGKAPKRPRMRVLTFHLHEIQRARDNSMYKEIEADVPIQCSTVSIDFRHHPNRYPPQPFQYMLAFDANYCIGSGASSTRYFRTIEGLDSLPNLSSFVVTGVPLDDFDQVLLRKLVCSLKSVTLPTDMWTKELLALRCWRGTHPVLLNIAIAMAPLALPVYVIMWICDFLPDVASVPDVKKVRLIEGVQTSRRRLLHLRVTPAGAARRRRLANQVNR
jgi:hypothetical protein